MKNTKWTIMILAACISAQVSAQSFGEIHGKVVDPDGNPVEFGIVRAERGGVIVGAETDSEGRFILKPLDGGEYDVKVQGMGFQPMEITGVRVDPGLIVRLKDITLNSLLGTVVIEYTRWEEPLIRPDDPSRIVITTAQIKTNAARKDPVKMLASITPGVTKSRNSDELYFRGSRAGTMAYYVDGVKVASSNPGVASEAISSVSVYTGGLPAKYGDVTGGVIAIETKSYFDLYQQRNSRR